MENRGTGVGFVGRVRMWLEKTGRLLEFLKEGRGLVEMKHAKS